MIARTRSIRPAALGSVFAVALLAVGGSGFMVPAGYAQVTPPPPARGDATSLVLSGGGARGLSHAGAIVALDELGYDPSLVVGTSMGAIVGALYAAGYSPAEVWTFVAGENWLERFAAEPVPVGRGRVPLRPVLGFGVGRGRFFEGLLPTTNVNLRLVELLFDAGARARNDFDRLPRRYRAVAADLGTGEEVVLGAGDLPRAVRASMAVPGAFSPVLWDGRILVDGGLANNLPVSVAAGLSDDPIIAVDVLGPGAALEERSSIDLGIRALRLLIANVRPDSVAPDLLVTPEIDAGFSETRFPSDATELLESGRSAVGRVPAPVQRADSGLRTAADPPRVITALRVDAEDAAVRRLVRRIMQPAVGPYDPASIIARTAALYSTGLFHGVWPRLEFDQGDDGAATLVVDVTPIASTSTAAAVRWDNDMGGGGWFSLRQRAAAITPVEVRAGIMMSELSRGASIDGSLFSSLMPGLIWNAGLHYGNQRVRVFAGDSLARTDSHSRGGGWAGAELHGPVRDWFVSALARVEHLRAETGDDGWGWGPYVRLGPPPRVDRVIGVDPLIEWESRLGQVEYSRGRVRLGVDRVLAPGMRASVFADVHGATRGAPADVRPAATRELAPWLEAGRLRGRSTATAGVDVARRMLLDGWVRLRLRAIQAGDWHVGGEAGAVWPTFVGPIAAGIAFGGGDGLAELHAWRFNLSLGSSF